MVIQTLLGICTISQDFISLLIQLTMLWTHFSGITRDMAMDSAFYGGTQDVLFFACNQYCRYSTSYFHKRTFKGFLGVFLNATFSVGEHINEFMLPEFSRSAFYAY